MLVLTGICQKKINPRKKCFDLFFLNVRKIFFNPLNGSLTEIFLATGGGVGGRSTKTFSLQGVVEFRSAILADTPPPQGLVSPLIIMLASTPTIPTRLFLLRRV
jgi:hypothetical protein